MDVATRRSGTTKTAYRADYMAAPALRKPQADAAVYGAKAWAAYWLVECFFVVLLPWLLAPSYEYRRPHPGLTALLLLIYVACGAVSGIVLAALPPLRQRLMSAGLPESQWRAFGTLTLICAFTVNYALNGLTNGKRDVFCLAVCGLVGAAAALAIFSDRWRQRVRPFTNAWAASFLLIAAPWCFSYLDYGVWTAAFKASMSAAAVGAVAGTAWLLDRVWARQAHPGGARRRAVVFASGAVLMVGLNLLFHQTPLITPPPAGAVPAGNSPNIVLITLDTVRADHLSVYGYDRNTTPNLKQFAQNAALYTHAISPSDMTLSSHASIFTGLYAKRHGAHLLTGKSVRGDIGAALPDSIPTLAELLGKKGYKTIGVVSNLFFLRDNYRLNRGFQYYSQTDPVLFLASAADLYFLRDGICGILHRFTLPEKYDRGYRHAGELNEEAVGLLKEAKAEGRPWFLFLNYMDAHEVYFPPAPFDTMFPGKDPHLGVAEYLKNADEILSGRRPYPESERRRDMSQYDGGVAYIDFEFGKLIGRLKSMGLYDNSVIVVTADHGQAFGERHLVGHMSSVYQDQVHVPLLIHFPGQRAPQIVDRRVSGVDLMPTLLDALRVPVPPGLDGRSFYRADQNPEGAVYTESYPDDHRVAVSPRFNRIEHAIFEGKYKFISSTAGKREMYDLSSDPNETRNLYRPNDPTARELEAKLMAWAHTNTKPAGGNVQLAPVSRDKLKSLGYVQ